MADDDLVRALRALRDAPDETPSSMPTEGGSMRKRDLVSHDPALMARTIERMHQAKKGQGSPRMSGGRDTLTRDEVKGTIPRSDMSQYGQYWDNRRYGYTDMDTPTGTRYKFKKDSDERKGETQGRKNKR